MIVQDLQSIWVRFSRSAPDAPWCQGAITLHYSTDRPPEEIDPSGISPLFAAILADKRDRTLTPWTLLLRGDRVESVTLTVVFTAASLGVPLSDMLAPR